MLKRDLEHDSFKLTFYSVTIWIIPAGVGSIIVSAQSVRTCNSNRLRGGTQNKDPLTKEELSLCYSYRSRGWTSQVPQSGSAMVVVNGGFLRFFTLQESTRTVP